MDIDSILAASSHAFSARKCLDLLNNNADNIPFSQKIWIDFITEFNRSLNKIQHGAKAGYSSAWAGVIRNDLRKDELLRYIKNSRDAHEHGIQDITSHSADVTLIPGPGIVKFISLTIETYTDGVQKVNIIPPVMRLDNEKMVLNTIFNRNIKYDPPKKHLGIELLDTSPQEIARLALSYLDKKIEEGRSIAIEILRKKNKK